MHDGWLGLCGMKDCFMVFVLVVLGSLVVDKLFRHCFILNVEFFFFLLNIVSRLLSNGPLNLYINWKDGWILGLKPLHESDEVL
jgi:hypothetical protein